MSFNKTYYNIFNSPYEFFEKTKAITKGTFSSKFSRAREILEECETCEDGGFNGNWKKVCKKFADAEFEDEASLTSETIDEISTVDFNEIKWKFQQRLTEGDGVDVERYIAGQERCWYGCRRLPRSRQAIRIYINFGGNCFRSSKELSISGAMGVTFAEIMESMGIAAEIWAVHYSVGMDADGNDYVEMIRLKQQNEYCDFGLVNFMLGNDGVFRNGIFRANCYHAMKNGNDVSWGLGQSRSANLDILGLTEEEKQSSIVVPQVYSKEAAVKWLEEVLSDQKKLHDLTYADEETVRGIK